MDVRGQRQADNGMGEMPAAVRRSAMDMTGSSMMSRIMGVLLIIVILAGIIWFANRAANTLMADSTIKGKQYQALFLTNGQVYFCKLTHVDASYVKCTDIYYLQVQQTVQPKDSSSSSANNQQVSLAKLGGELHGPEDVMYVSRQQVLFWENLKNDGKVVKAISDYKASGNK